LQVVASVAYGTIISFVAIVAQDRGLEGVGGFFALLAISSLGVRLAAGRAYDVWGPTTVLSPIFGTLAAGMALLAVASGPGLFFLAAVAIGLGIGGTHTTLLAKVVDRSSPHNRAQSVAAFTASWEFGVGVGTILMGRIAETVGFAPMFLLVAALPLLGLATLGPLGLERARRA
jgi:MFS family permease